jgi:hypothetical protein
MKEDVPEAQPSAPAPQPVPEPVRIPQTHDPDPELPHHMHIRGLPGSEQRTIEKKENKGP